jgi:hypothetical protein
MPLHLRAPRESPTVSSLPQAGPQYAGLQFVVYNPPNPTRVYVCVQDSSGNWEWLDIGTTL